MQSLYFFDERATLPESDLVGGKGLSLMRMSRLGLRIPYGFIISSSVWKEYKKIKSLSPAFKNLIRESVQKIESATGLTYGDALHPLILSARSGAKFSMPGMMESVVNIGITKETFNGLEKRIGKQSTVDSYIRFLSLFGSTVLNIGRQKFEGLETGEERIEKYRKVIRSHTSVNLDDPWELLSLSIMAVFDSFDNPGAIEYRNSTGIPHDIGTAVIVQQMVFGNVGKQGGSAVVFSRNQLTGKRELSGNYLENIQGDDVVKGALIPKSISSLPEGLKREIAPDIFQLEKEWKNVIDVEITWEDDQDPKKIYFLQCRPLKTAPHMYFRIQEHLVADGVRTIDDVLKEVSIGTVYSSRLESFTPPFAKEEICTGSPIHTGYGIGKAVFSVEEAKRRLAKKEDIVLFCSHFDPNDLELLTSPYPLRAVVVSKGSPASHMGLVLAALNISGIVGVNTINRKVKPDEYISVDAEKGIVYGGKGNVAPQEQNGFTDIIAKKWVKMNGSNNAWTDFRSEKTSLPIEKEIARSIEKSGSYSSKKARQTAIVNTCFDSSYAIYTDLVPGADTDAVFQSIIMAKKMGKGVWMRSAYTPDLLQGPYTNIDLTQVSDKALLHWLKTPQQADTLSKFGSYPIWQKMVVGGKTYAMQYALIQHDEPGKLDKNVAHEHFSCSMRAERGFPTRAIVDIFDGSPHTRLLGQKNESEIMSIIIVANKLLTSKIGRVHFRFGASTFNQDQLFRYHTQTDLLTRLSAIGCHPQNDAEFVLGINKLAENNQITKHELSFLIDPRKWEVIQYVSSIIIHEWWRRHDLPTRMWALHKQTGAGVLEVQGRYSQANKWIKIYGTKGEEEQSLSMHQS